MRANWFVNTKVEQNKALVKKQQRMISEQMAKKTPEELHELVNQVQKSHQNKYSGKTLAELHLIVAQLKADQGS